MIYRLLHIARTSGIG